MNVTSAYLEDREGMIVLHLRRRIGWPVKVYHAVPLPFGKCVYFEGGVMIAKGYSTEWPEHPGWFSDRSFKDIDISEIEYVAEGMAPQHLKRWQFPHWEYDGEMGVFVITD